MARRLTQALETASPRPAGLPPLLVRAGYEAGADLHATPLAPDRLLEHAGAALIQARTAGNGERIRAYQEEITRSLTRLPESGSGGRRRGRRARRGARRGAPS